jgi:hypothetical protein
MTNEEKKVEQLLHDLSIILNAHQDIQDVLDGGRPLDFQKLRAANDRIGEAVMRHLPE